MISGWSNNNNRRCLHPFSASSSPCPRVGANTHRVLSWLLCCSSWRRTLAWSGTWQKSWYQTPEQSSAESSASHPCREHTQHTELSQWHLPPAASVFCSQLLLLPPLRNHGEHTPTSYLALRGEKKKRGGKKEKERESTKVMLPPHLSAAVLVYLHWVTGKCQNARAKLRERQTRTPWKEHMTTGLCKNRIWFWS